MIDYLNLTLRYAHGYAIVERTIYQLKSLYQGNSLQEKGDVLRRTCNLETSVYAKAIVNHHLFVPSDHLSFAVGSFTDNATVLFITHGLLSIYFSLLEQKRLYVFAKSRSIAYHAYRASRCTI
jgi:hypothetical protein